MSNALTKKTGGFGLADIAAGLRRTRASTPSFGGKPYLKFGNDGEWTLGKGGREAMNGRTVIFNMASLKAGYVCWTDYDKNELKKLGKKKKNEKIGEEMALAALGGVDPDKLPDVSDDNGDTWEWKQQQSIEGRFTDGDRREFVYNVSSGGGLEALDGVFDAVMARIELQNEDRFINPMIELQDDWYDHTTYGKTYKPILDIVGWADEDGVPEGEEAPKVEKETRDKKKDRAEDEEPGADPDDEEDERGEDRDRRSRRSRAKDRDEEPEQGDDEEPEQGDDEEAGEEPPVRRRRRR